MVGHLLESPKIDVNIKNNASLTAYEISMNSETRAIFDSSGKIDNIESSGYGRTMFRGNVIHNDREA